MPYLTSEDKAFFKENGFLEIRQAIDPKIVASAQNVFWEHMNQMNPEIQRGQPETWMGNGYRTVQCGNESEIKGLIYQDPIFAMAEELVGKDQLHPGGGAGPHVNFPREGKWNPPPNGHLDGYHTPHNGVPKGTVGHFTLGATVYLDDVEKMGGGFTVWPGSHRVWAEFFRYHDVDCLPGGVAPFDLGSGYEFTGQAGDVCLWHGLMTHTAGHNVSRNIRIACIARLRRKNFNEIRYDFSENMWKYWEGLD